MKKLLNKAFLLSSSLFLMTNIANAENIIEKSSSISNVKKEEANKKRLSFKAIGVKIEDIKDNKTTINIGNLIIGQSGIVVHVYNNDKRLIVSNAQVIQSDANTSTILFTKFNDLKQNAIPTSNRTVEKNDILVLNYLYTSSLLIAPTQDTFQVVRSNFKYNNFLHSDVFAAKLKVDNQPFPKKEEIQKFAIEQNLGTIFFVLNQSVYVVDTKTFKILTSYNIEYKEDNSQVPFYTRVEDIKTSPLTFSLFSNDDELSYEEYYKSILGLK